MLKKKEEEELKEIKEIQKKLIVLKQIVKKY